MRYFAVILRADGREARRSGSRGPACATVELARATLGMLAELLEGERVAIVDDAGTIHELGLDV